VIQATIYPSKIKKRQHSELDVASFL